MVSSLSHDKIELLKVAVFKRSTTFPCRAEPVACNIEILVHKDLYVACTATAHHNFCPLTCRTLRRQWLCNLPQVAEAFTASIKYLACLILHRSSLKKCPIQKTEFWRQLPANVSLVTRGTTQTQQAPLRRRRRRRRHCRWLKHRRHYKHRSLRAPFLGEHS